MPPGPGKRRPGKCSKGGAGRPNEAPARNDSESGPGPPADKKGYLLAWHNQAALVVPKCGKTSKDSNLNILTCAYSDIPLKYKLE